jgi:glycosyltransferase involved in cell wall biosynthesis
MVSNRLLACVLAQETSIVASVIIHTRDRATFLNLTLRTLERQFFPSHAWELVIVDHSSVDETPVVLDEYKRRGQLPLVQLRTSRHRGFAGSLNDALRVSRGRLLVLLGDDRLVPRDFLTRHIVSHARNCAVVVGASHRSIHTHLLPLGDAAAEGVSPTPALVAEDLDHPERLAWLMFDGGAQHDRLFGHLRRSVGPEPSTWACFDMGNASFPRQEVLDIGGFDETFLSTGTGAVRIAGLDLAYRLHRSGLPIHFEPGAIALKQCRASVETQTWEWRRVQCTFIRKHPELNPSLTMPILL